MPRKKNLMSARKSATHKTVTKGRVKATTKSAKPQPKKSTKSAGASRAAGIKLFNLAGRPTREQFVLVYGESGPSMTWDQRAAAGIPAEKFQIALAKRQAK